MVVAGRARGPALTTRRFPPPWSVEELDVLLCQIESRIKKTPAFRAGVFSYANKSGARGFGGWGKAPDLWLLWAGDYSKSV
jgi:hypothetical protein